MPYHLAELLRTARAGQLIGPILGASFDWRRTTGGSWRDLGDQAWTAAGSALASSQAWVRGRDWGRAGGTPAGPQHAVDDGFDAEVVCHGRELVTLHTRWATSASSTADLILRNREAARLTLGNEDSTVDAPIPVPRGAHYVPQLEAFTADIRRDTDSGRPRVRGARPRAYTDAITQQNLEWVLTAQGWVEPLVTVRHALTAEQVVDAAVRSAAGNESGGWGPWTEIPA